MKSYCKITSVAAMLALSVFCAQAQDIEDRILTKAKQRANRKVDRTIDNGLDKVEKGIDEKVKGGTKDKEAKSEETGAEKQEEGIKENKAQSAEPKSFEAYTKFDFVPGNVVLFLDEFTADNVGDFPSKWNTNGAGEVVSGDDHTQWFEIKGSSQYLPVMNKTLPEEYTIEFDLRTSGLSRKTSSTANFQILLDDNTKFTKGKNFAWVRLYLTQYTDVGLKVTNRVNGEQVMDNTLKLDLRKKVMEGMRISIAVNKKRFRMWADDRKVLDVPTLMPAGIQQLKFALEGFAQDFEGAHVYVDNVKIAEGGVDLRSKLITEGRLSTTAITFGVNSDKLKPESMGIIREIAAVLEANADVKVRIIGHTDSDGDDAKNFELSKRRSQAVKEALVNVFNIGSDRIVTDGKGESQPAAPNDSPEGKAANRRVEFVKL